MEIQLKYYMRNKFRNNSKSKDSIPFCNVWNVFLELNLTSKISCVYAAAAICEKLSAKPSPFAIIQIILITNLILIHSDPDPPPHPHPLPPPPPHPPPLPPPPHHHSVFFARIDGERGFANVTSPSAACPDKNFGQREEKPEEIREKSASFHKPSFCKYLSRTVFLRVVFSQFSCS